MAEHDLPSGFLADCPARLAVEVLSDKWAVATIAALSRGPLRHQQLVDVIGEVSRKVLTHTLRRLQHLGLIDRHQSNEGPVRVEYRLTSLGSTLMEPINVLNAWSKTYGDDIVRAAAASHG